MLKIWGEICSHGEKGTCIGSLTLVLLLAQCCKKHVFLQSSSLLVLPD